MNLLGFLRLVAGGIILVGFLAIIARAIIKRVARNPHALRSPCIVAVLLAYGLFCFFNGINLMAIPAALAFAIAGFCSYRLLRLFSRNELDDARIDEESHEVPTKK